MLWVVEQRSLWGDYGAVLISGYAGRESAGGQLLLHRAGPFLPPISFPYVSTEGRRIVVSDEFRRELERSGFPGLAFGPAVKARIVKLAWHEWDRSAETPKRYPPGGEPESYVWEKAHDARSASRMPEAWEFLPQVVPLATERLEDPRGGYLDKFRARRGRRRYPGLFRDDEKYAKLIVNDVTRGWLESRVGEWVQFCDVELVDR